MMYLRELVMALMRKSRLLEETVLRAADSAASRLR
jgi:hypothetical protein